jgi:hypothetical protein
VNVRKGLKGGGAYRIKASPADRFFRDEKLFLAG